MLGLVITAIFATAWFAFRYFGDPVIWDFAGVPFTVGLLILYVAFLDAAHRWRRKNRELRAIEEIARNTRRSA